MQLVVEGTERFKWIISAGYSDYTIGLNQSLIEIDDADWKGYRKSDVHWDDQLEKIIEEPFPLSDQEIENTARAEAMVAGTELNIKDENGDVRWRIIVNESGKLQVEVDPIDQPHIGEWLLNGEMGHPKLQDGQLMICLDGELQAISIAELKELMDEI